MPKKTKKKITKKGELFDGHIESIYEYIKLIYGKGIATYLTQFLTNHGGYG